MFIFFLCLSLLWAQTSAPQKLSDRERAGLIGPVKRMAVEWTPDGQPRFNIAPGTRCRQATTVYDETGRVTQSSLYPGSCGADEIRTEYTYAKDGSYTKRTQEIRGRNSPPPPPPMAMPSGEREQGEPREIYQYDSVGRPIEVSVVRPSGKLIYKTTFIYDLKGRETEIRSYDENGKPGDRRVYSYQNDGKVPSGFAYYGSDGKVYIKSEYKEYEFNSRGDWIKRKEITEEIYGGKRTSLIYRTIEYY